MKSVFASNDNSSNSSDGRARIRKARAGNISVVAAMDESSHTDGSSTRDSSQASDSSQGGNDGSGSDDESSNDGTPEFACPRAQKAHLESKAKSRARRSVEMKW